VRALERHRRHDPGGAAEFAVAPVANCVKLPDHVRTEDAALIEPLSCAVRGYDVLRSQLAPGADLRLRHDGPDDAGAGQADRRRVVEVVDLNPERLATAKQLGCSRRGDLGGRAGPAARLGRRHRRTGNEKAIQDGLGRVARAARSCSSASPTTTPA
jgi:threonine dehydrogenase-like Zn-dependent dehydrogenase